MAFDPPYNANEASYRNYNQTDFQQQAYDDDWVAASNPSITSPRPFTRVDSLESIGQFGFTDPFPQKHDCSRRVRWNKGVKDGRQTVGCAAFQQRCNAAAFARGCSAFPNAFDDAEDVSVSDKPKGFLQRFAEVAITNVQKCGVGLGQKCEGGAVNISALSSVIGDAMCKRCGADFDGDFNQSRCMHCQTYFNGERDTGTIGLRGHRHSPANAFGVSGRASHSTTHHVSNNAPLHQTRDPIAQARDNIAASRNPMMEPRVQVVQCDYFESKNQVGYTNGHGRYGVGSQMSTRRNDAPFTDDANENDRYAMNHHNINDMSQAKRRRHGVSGNRRSMKVKTKLIGRCVAKSLSNPVQRLRHGMQLHGAKRILTITRGR